MAENETYMRRAIELAWKGSGWTNPNPLVGAVIVKDGKIIGEGFHHKYGELHAEREALKDCLARGNDPAGAEIFVTLEPCCHFGKQPPCCQALAEVGIKRVFVGSRDPNPLVHGQGNSFLREKGIEVIEDFLRQECDALNPIFFHYITTKRPYVALKYAMTADGKIATKTGASKWITGEAARAYVHQLRNRYAAILCGIGTVLADNPMLNCRMTGGNNPLRVICDSKLRIPLDCQLVKTAKEIPTIVACAEGLEASEGVAQKISALKTAGLEILQLPLTSEGSLDLTALMQILGQLKIDSVLIEGGGEINYSALKAGIVNKIYAFIAPKLFGGGSAAKSPVSGEGIAAVEEAFLFKLTKIRQFEEDLLIEYEK
ncbi:riboflavin biosynthesis protein RibD [Treponema sp. JC4]|uniref:bifunctional diaminohydroxyphosphoribosylaminopyrimidine deaminase/5-amino-6-(5-phosphoribosylamino)uracil reductase RibD n=1 Tax=Treponema sp. JC4 TaxID=1124982 RepID=UPI00025B02A4|nr:bifunctional diaminohydroxyphosphoribosylaminopyrimidine deaminase/5-amino-6-(5-phosphoribosylamino)uracil reductase RibD [Treponema sp. JC4]EID85501.1 riboflavin biosynthesis protein RibD [Treponema sp. JC4]